MMKAKQVPGELCGEAVMATVFVLNRNYTRSVSDKTPFEAWYGKKPVVHFLKVFGCIAHVRDTRPHLKKLEDRSKPMVFIGHEEGSKAYRVYDPVEERVHITRDVVFDEAAQWDWDDNANRGDPAAASTSDPFTVDMIEVMVPAPQVQTPVPASPVPGTPEPILTPPGMEFASPPSNASTVLDADHSSGAPIRFRAVDDLLGDASPRGLAPRELSTAELHIVSADEPASFVEAEQQQCWRRAMLEEMRSIEENGTCSIPSSH